MLCLIFPMVMACVWQKKKKLSLLYIEKNKKFEKIINVLLI